jgi:phospho-N-acetylmuramoyl-pentapeptide-transferase
VRELYISTITAFVAAIILGYIFIPFLSRLKFGQEIRKDGPQSHLSKKGTPTMGGIIILFALVISFLFSGVQDNDYMAVIITTLLFSSIGFMDDYKKVVLKRSLGLKAKQKLFVQIVFSIGLSYYGFTTKGTWIIIPFSGYALELGLWYIPFTAFMITAIVNAVNLTDGLDGLAAGLIAIVGFFYSLMTLTLGYGTATIFSGSLVGACIGFLRFNSNPAQVFMGDTGSLALGAAISALAVITRTHLYLPIVGAIFVLETLSVIIQVIYFRFTSKRIFKMSPLHHHFELSGFGEKRVVITFWMVTLLIVILSFAALN